MENVPTEYPPWDTSILCCIVVKRGFGAGYRPIVGCDRRDRRSGILSPVGIVPIPASAGGVTSVCGEVAEYFSNDVLTLDRIIYMFG